MKNKLLITIITLLLLSTLSSCVIRCSPTPIRSISGSGSTVDEAIEDYENEVNRIFSSSYVNKKLKDFYGTYYLPNFNNLSKYDITPLLSPHINYLIHIGGGFDDEDMSFDRFINKYVYDYYLMGQFYTRYMIKVDDLISKYNISIYQYSNNCYTKKGLDESSIIHERKIYAYNYENINYPNDEKNLLSLDYLTSYIDSDETFVELLIEETTYYLTPRGEKINMYGTTLNIKPDYITVNETERVINYFKYQDFLYLFSDEYKVSSEYNALDTKLKEFYDDLVLEVEKKEVFISK